MKSIAVSLTVFFGVLSILASGGEKIAPQSATDPIFSPDGKQVAFVLKGPKNMAVAAVPAEGGKHKVLAEFEKEMIIAQWFPDGGAVLVAPKSGSGGIWKVAADGSGKKQLATGEAARIAPDGKTLAFLAENKMNLLDIDSGRQNPVGDKSADGWRIGPWLNADRLTALTADGTLMALDKNNPGKWIEVVPHMSMVNNFVQTAFGAESKMFALSSDDVQDANPDNISSIWFFTLEGNKSAQVIGRSAFNPVWTAKGDLFFSRRALIFRTADLKRLVPLVEGETWAVNPEGTLLVVSRRDADTNGDGLVNWLDAARLYRAVARENDAELDNTPLVAVGESGGGEALEEKQGNPVLGVLFSALESDSGAEFGKRTAECHRAKEPPKIDGILDDPCWKDAEELTGFYLSGGMDTLAEPGHQTHLWLLFDDQYIYVSGRAEHPDIEAIVNFCKPGERDGDIWRDENIDLSFDISHSHQRYYQLIIGCGTSFFDTESERMIRDTLDTNSRIPRLAGKTFNKNNIKWDSAAEFATAKEKKAWTMEGRIPLADMGVRKIYDGTYWGFSAARLEKGAMMASSHGSRWCPSLQPRFDQPQWFGHLVFGKQVLKISEISWGVGRGKCQLNAVLESKEKSAKPIRLRLMLGTEGKQETLGEADVRFEDKSAKIEIKYALPENIKEGNLALGIVSGDDFVGLRGLFFTLSPPLKLITSDTILSSRTKALDFFAWMPYGAESLKDLCLKIEVRNATAKTVYRAQVDGLQNMLAAIRLDTALIGEGKGVVRVSLVGKDGTVLESGAFPFEIIADPFGK